MSAKDMKSEVFSYFKKVKGYLWRKWRCICIQTGR